MLTPVQVAVKVGSISKSSRTSVPVENAEFAYDEQHDSYSDFCSKVEERVVASLRRYEVKTTRDDTRIYIKPSQTAAQKDFAALSADNFNALISSARVNYQKRKKASGPFTIEVFVFAAKTMTGSLVGTRRATATRIQEATRNIDAFLTARPDIQVGEIARTHWSMVHARQPEGSAVDVPDTATFAQAQHLDALRSASPANGESIHQTITVRLNGSSDLQLTLNVTELRQVLGLPSHNILAHGIFQSFVAPSEPADDIDDVDHMSD